MRKAYFWLIMILLVGTACSPAVTIDEQLEVTAVAQTPAQSEQAESTAPAATEDQPPQTLLIFHRSGGFAGLDQEWTIYTDGQIEMPDGGQKMADAAQLQNLLDTIEVADFFNLNDSYIPKDTCCDRFFYTITVQLDGATKTVDTIDAAPEQPERLTAVLGAINQLIQNVK